MPGIPASPYAGRDRRPLTESLDLAPDALPAGGSFHPEEDVLELLADEVRRARPAQAVALGAGLGAVVIARAQALAGAGRLWVMADDQRAMALTGEMLAAVGAGAELIAAELEAYDGHNLWYARHLMDRLPDRIDLMFIDGPGHFAGRMPRWPAGPELFGRLAPDGAAVLDDGARVKQKKTLKAWARAFPDLEQRATGTSGGAVILRRN